MKERYFVSHGSRFRSEGTIHAIYWNRLKGRKWQWWLVCRITTPYGELVDNIENSKAKFCKRCFPPVLV